MQGPFEIPIHLGHEGEVWEFRVHRRDRSWPKRLWRHSPGSLEYVRQKQHRHVAAHTVTLAGDRDQLVDAHPLQLGIGIVELQGVGPAREIGVAAISQGGITVTVYKIGSQPII